MSLLRFVKSYDMLNGTESTGMLENGYDYNVFSSLPTTTYTANVSSMNNTWFPFSRVQKNDEGYEVIIELPGLSRSDIDVSVLGKTLTVVANREVKNGKLQYKQDYKNSWALPDHTSFETVNARYEAGVLTVSVPLKKEYSRNINIE